MEVAASRADRAETIAFADFFFLPYHLLMQSLQTCRKKIIQGAEAHSRAVLGFEPSHSGRGGTFFTLLYHNASVWCSVTLSNVCDVLLSAVCLRIFCNL